MVSTMPWLIVSPMVILPIVPERAGLAVDHTNRCFGARQSDIAKRRLLQPAITSSPRVGGIDD